MNRLIQRTGMLNVATLPKNAYIFLNDKPQKKSAFSLFKKDYLTTPNKIKNLTPGDYLLRFEKENYWPLEQKITITSGQTTFAEDINLFRSDLPFLLYPSPETKITINNNKPYFHLNETGVIINVENEKKVFSEMPNENSVWMKNSLKLFSAGIIYDLENNDFLDLSLTVGQEIQNWYYEYDNDKLYYQHNNSISLLTNDYKTSSLILQGENYTDYEVRSENIFTITEDKNKVYLRNYNIDSKINTNELSLPTIGDYSFDNGNQKYLAVYDQKNLTLYLININNWQDSTIIKNIKSWSWINENELIYNNNWEINHFNLENKKIQLITRVSDDIEQVLWNTSKNYFIFSTFNGINVGDTNNKNIINIFKTEKVKNITLDEKNNLLYFYAKNGQQEGIYKIILQ